MIPNLDPPEPVDLDPMPVVGWDQIREVGIDVDVPESERIGRAGVRDPDRRVENDDRKHRARAPLSRFCAAGTIASPWCTIATMSRGT